MAALLLAGSFGCADHGPVDVFSRELFDKNIAPAQLDYAVATPLTVTTNVPSSPTSIGVSLINNGASSTYGPIVVTFSSSDPLLVLIPEAFGAPVLAFGADSPGKEVRASTVLIPVVGGYQSSGGNIETLSSTAFRCYYNGTPPPFPYTPVTIFMKIQDAIGNTWNTQFLMYV